jgi:predicted aconitase with swiveling domain
LAVIMMQPGSAGSVSRLKIAIEIEEKGSALAELVRHLAPLTTGAILKSLPLQDRVHRYADNFVYIETRLMIGAEKRNFTGVISLTLLQIAPFVSSYRMLKSSQ